MQTYDLEHIGLVFMHISVDALSRTVPFVIIHYCLPNCLSVLFLHVWTPACMGLHSMHGVTQHALGYTVCIGIHSMHWATCTACIGLHSTACTELKSMHCVTACPVAHPVCSCNMISFSGSVTVYYDVLGSLLTHIPSLTSPYIHSACVCACSRMCVHAYMYACRHMCVGVGAHVGVWGV